MSSSEPTSDVGLGEIDAAALKALEVAEKALNDGEGNEPRGNTPT